MLVNQQSEKNCRYEDMSHWANIKTKEQVRIPEAANRPEGWFDEHAYMLSPEKVNELTAKAVNEKVFLCGIPSNDIDFFDVFDKIIFLEIDKETMLGRIKNRDNNTFGQSEDSLALLLKWFDPIRLRYEKAGATFIDAAKPVNLVVDEVIRNS